MGASLRLGKIFGIPIEINVSWIFAFGLMTYLSADLFGQYQPTWPEIQKWGISLVTSLLFSMSVLAHELTHSLMAERWGIPVQKITLFIFGGVSQLAYEARRPMIEFTVSVVGPLSSVALSGVFAGLWLLFRDSFSVLSAVLFVLAWVNLGMGVFNLLPGFPLDGGRVMRSAVWGLTGSYWKATQIAALAGQFLGVSMIVAGIVLVVLTGGFQSAWMALIGTFLLSAATTSYRQEQEREKSKKYTVGQVMVARWPVPATPVILEGPHTAPSDTLFDAVERIETLGASRIPVIKNGMIVGMIGLEQMLSLPDAKRSRRWISIR